MAIERDYYDVLIVGGSGKGKTYSARNLDPVTTGFINVENKPLPFKNNFKYHKRINDINGAKAALKEYSENPEIKCIFFDSFSAYVDMLLAHCRATKKGFDIWNLYNEEIGKLLTFIKSIKKEVFVTAHYEWLQDEGGAKERRTKIKGKEWEGMVEKDFTIVLYADNKFEGKKPIYTLNTVLENSSAKCPPDLFGAEVYSIDNDCKIVFDTIQKFVK